MVALIIFLLAAFGATNIITGSKLFAPVRNLGKRLPGRFGKTAGGFLQCSMCVSWWVGVFWFAIGLVDIDLKWHLGWLAAGCMASAFCWITHVVLRMLGEDEL